MGRADLESFRRCAPGTLIMHRHLGTLAIAFTLALVLPARCEADPVEVREQEIVLPTYLAGPPELNPMFDFGQASQGAQGRIYPYPLYDTLTHQKRDVTYRLVTLENEYVRIGILPEIGGRLFEAVDKTNGYHFVYRQHVIKPALIGLIGAWISGGIEWNIPHHHRASTFLPVQYRIEESPDGARTVWVGELEIRHRMRWAVGYTLRPGSSVLEAQVRIVNRTPLPHSMLCFANVAVHVNDDYQVLFPPRTRYVTFHGKREFTTWPIATGRYAGSDYSAGVDVSWYRNHENATSMFAWNFDDDFFAGYDHGRQAGIMSVADHRVVPGKKLWTWGNGPRGRMWDRILSDDDGPYIELMVGAYSDNQPDYSWLRPHETRSFSMHWYPFRALGGVKNANLEAAVNLHLEAGKARIAFCTTRAHQQAVVKLAAAGNTVLEETVAIDPGHPYAKTLELPAGLDPNTLRASLSAGDRELVAYESNPLPEEARPKPVEPPADPSKIESVERLDLAGLRIAQFHDPSRDPEPFWEEALKRDPGDSRAHTWLGLRLLDEGRPADASLHFRKALDRITTGYTSPIEASPFYYLGVALAALGKDAEADQAFSRAAWDTSWRSPAEYGLAEIACRRGDRPAAMEHLARALETNSRDLRAWTLQAALLRHLGRRDEALAALDSAARLADPLDTRILAERWFNTRAERDAVPLDSTLRQHLTTALETAMEFRNAGLQEDGRDLLARLVAAPRHAGEPALSPLVLYLLADLEASLGQNEEAAAHRQQAAGCVPDTLFPFQHEFEGVLERAIAANPSDPRAPYHLGNLIFDSRPEQAIALWERAAQLDPAFPIVHRNLALAWSRRPSGNDLPRAIAALETATDVRDPLPLHLAELDELYEATGVDPSKRLARFESHQTATARRDDALSREISLLVAVGRYDDAIRLLRNREFAVWEGGTLRVADDWTDAHLLRGFGHLNAGRFDKALDDAHAAGAVPSNLPSERIGSTGREVELAVLEGLALEAQGKVEPARGAFERAAASGASAKVHRELNPLRCCFGAVALRRLGKQAEASEQLQRLLDQATRSLQGNDPATASSEPAASQVRRRRERAGPHLALAVAELGLGHRPTARQALEGVLVHSPDHPLARALLADFDRFADLLAPPRP